MKKLLFALPLCFLFTACKKTETVTITETIDLKRGLLAYYPFNGNANDTSGNNKNGIAMNGLAYSADAQNKTNSAANFDGIDDYVNIADPGGYFAPPKMTVSFMFNLRDVNKRGSFVTKSAFTTSSSVSWSCGLSVNNTPYFEYTLANADNSCSALWGSPNAQGHSIKYNTALQNNKWYHATLIFNMGVEMMYINGTLVSAKISNYTTLNNCSAADLKIGGWWQNDIVSINGKFDELRIYNRILAENEIEKLAQEIN